MPVMMRIVALLASLVANPLAAEPATLSDLAAALADDQDAIALGLGVRRDGVTELAVTGTTRRGGDEPAIPDAPFHIGSITKGFTATLLMMLAERGVIDFDAPLRDLLPGAALHPDWQVLTLPQILSHTAGLPDNFGLTVMLDDPGPDLPAARAAALADLWVDPLPNPAGSFAYSNVGYVLAGHIAEVAAGRAWEDLIRTDIAGPLGLDTLGFGPPQGPGVPWGHAVRLGFRIAADPTGGSADNTPLLGPAGTIHLSLADLLAWGQFQIDACRGLSPLLSAAGCARLHEPVLDGYGLGFYLMDHVSPAAFGHNGTNTFWHAILMIVPDRDLVLVAARNDGDVDGGEEAGQALARWALAPAD
jgi:CubicO group peptidase (beta-lactamase class C family)